MACLAAIAPALLTPGEAHGLHASMPVQAVAETTPVPGSGDAADDPAIWVHPTDPGLSLVIGSDKTAGLAIYDLDGSERTFHPVGDVNNVDVRYDFPLDGDLVDIVAAGNRSDQSIDVFMVDPTTRDLVDVSAGPLPIGVTEAYGFCLYRSWISGRTYAFVNDKDGDVEQYELFDDGNGKVDAVLVRSFSLSSQTEGMVADDEYGVLYIGEEQEGIWRYGAEPSDGSGPVLVDETDGDHLTADVEGLTIYCTGDGGGYLLASSQGDSSYAVYERFAPAGAPNQWLKNFEIVSGVVDGCEETDGIDVTSVSLGGAFPEGLFIAQDGVNSGGTQNFKLVPWPAIADTGAVPLAIDTSWDPRGGPDGVVVGACCFGGDGSCEVLGAGVCGGQGGDYQGNGTNCSPDPCEAPQPPGPAIDPLPGDGAAGVSVEAVLAWAAGAGAASHDVYFGTDPTPDAGEFQGSQPGTSFDPGGLEFSTTYFWRIDEVNGNGTTTGVVWSFETASASQPPAPPTAPSPADGAAGVSTGAVLNWSAGAGAATHEVYFGTDPTPDEGEFQGSQAGTSFDPGGLEFSTTYFWRVDEVNGNGTTTGAVWSFTTGAETTGVRFLGVATVATKKSHKIKVPVPAGTVAGDLLVAVIAKEKKKSIEAPEGWIEIDEGKSKSKKIRLGVFYRIAEADEPTAWKFKSKDKNRKAVGAILRYGGADPNAPIDDWDAKTGKSKKPKAPSAESTVDGALVLRVFGAYKDGYGSEPYPDDHDGRFILDSKGKVTAGAADAIQLEAGKTGKVKFRLKKKSYYRGVTVVIVPAGSGD